MKSLADIIAFNTAHADEALKFGQALLTASQAVDLTDPAQNAAYVSARDSQRAAARAAIDTALTTNNLEAILTPSGTMTGLGARAGLPADRRPGGLQRRPTAGPVGIAFNGPAFSEAKLLAFAYAYEQATKLRKTPSEINPAVWRCYSGNPRSCAPGREVATGVTLDFPLETATVADLQPRMTAGTLSATQLTKAYLQRIALTNTEGPSINAVRLLNPKALEEAAKADAERAAGTVRGPLHGIPVLVKDNLDAAGLPTTAGSVALENSVPDKDSTSRRQAARRGRDPARQAQPVRVRELPLQRPHAERLQLARRAGAQPLQRGHHAERLLERLRRGRGGRPGRDHDRHARRAARSRARPTRRASSACGPTSASSARTGILPISATQDTAGPMTRTVADAAAELARDRRQGPGGPRHRPAPARSRTTSRA